MMPNLSVCVKYPFKWNAYKYKSSKVNTQTVTWIKNRGICSPDMTWVFLMSQCYLVGSPTSILFLGEQPSGTMVITLTEYPWVSAAQLRSKSTSPIQRFPVIKGGKFGNETNYEMLLLLSTGQESLLKTLLKRLIMVKKKLNFTET